MRDTRTAQRGVKSCFLLSDRALPGKHALSGRRMCYIGREALPGCTIQVQ